MKLSKLSALVVAAAASLPVAAMASPSHHHGSFPAQRGRFERDHRMQAPRVQRVQRVQRIQRQPRVIRRVGRVSYFDYATSAPPAIRIERVRPRAGMVWQAGSWEWSSLGWQWMPGRYVVASASFQPTAVTWIPSDDGWMRTEAPGAYQPAYDQAYDPSYGQAYPSYDQPYDPYATTPSAPPCHE